MFRQSSKTIKLLAIALGAASLVGSARAAISIGPAGAGPLTFDAVPAVGDFATTAITGGGGGPAFVDTAGLDAFIIPTPASTIVSFSGQLPTTASIPLTTFAYAFRWNSTGHYIQSRPTTVSGTNTAACAAVIMLATLQNDTGGDQSAIQIEYDLGVSNQLAGELPGHRVYFSVTGNSGDWQVIPELSSVDTDVRLSASLSLGSWPSGSLMYLLWVDDNANGITDPGYTIDNMTFTVGTGPEVPVSIVNESSLTNRTLAEHQSLTYTITASGNPIQYQWFHDGAPIDNGTNCVNGHDRIVTGAHTGTLRISSVEPLDSGDYQCVVSNPLNSESSAVATLAVTPDTEKPAMLYAYVGANPNEIVVVFSEPLDDSCQGVGGGGAVSEPLDWVVEDIGAGSLGVAGFTNTVDLRGQTTIGLITQVPHDPSLPFRVTITENFFDTAAVQNVMTAGTYRVMTPLLPLQQIWSYDDQDIDPGPDWFTADPGVFPQGIGPFDAKRDGGEFHPNGLDDCRPVTLYDLGGVGTCLSLQSPVTQTNLITAYFWTQFNFAGNPGNSDLFFLGKADDGAVFYLNGSEVQRIRMPAAPAEITHDTFATVVIGDGDPRDQILISHPPGLQMGDNLLAVSLHQATLVSTDLTFGFQVYAVEPTSIVPRVHVTTSGGHPVISWEPAGGHLESKNNLTDPSWTQLSTTNPFTDTSGQPHRFYRVFYP